MWIKRIIEDEISSARANYLIIGPRQVGKSSLLSSALGIPPEAWLKSQNVDHPYRVYNLSREEEFLRFSRHPDLIRGEILSAAKKHSHLTVVVDEVQRVPALLNEIQSLIDFHKKSELRFYLTGSSARKLKRGGANLLPGRVIVRTMTPLIYPEWKPHFELDEILRIGALPGILTSDPTQKYDLLKSYVQTYLTEEIQAEGIARGIGPFARFIELAARYSGKQINYSSISRDAGVAYSTVRQYFQVLEDTLVGTLLPPFTGKTAKRLSLHPKFYLFDIGVRNSLVNLHAETIPATEFGTLFEHFILLEILRKAALSGQPAHLFFWRTHAGAEVDCVIQTSAGLSAIEIKAKLQIHRSELEGLRAFQETYGKNVKRSMVIALVDQPSLLDQIDILPWQQALALDFSNFF